MTLVIRNATSSEAARVHAVMADAFEAYRHAVPPTSALTETPASVQQLLQGHEEAALCFEAGRAVASVRFEIKDGLYFRRLAVLRSEQGRGIGSAMVRWLEREAVLRRQRRIWLKVRATEPANQAFYHKRGYEVLEQRDEVNSNGDVVAVVVMGKDLPSR